MSNVMLILVLFTLFVLPSLMCSVLIRSRNLDRSISSNFFIVVMFDIMAFLNICLLAKITYTLIQ